MERLKEAGDNQWLRGDWRDHIDALEDGTVALLFTDPPYGKAYRSDWRPGGKHKPNPHPQQIINDGEEEAVSELEAMLEAIFPKLIANAHLLIFVDPAKWEIVKAQVLRQGFTYRGQLVWDKTIGGMGDLKTTFAPQHELILHAVKGSPLVYSREPSVLSHPRPNGITRLPDGTSRHPHEKPVPLLHRLMMATTVKKHTVADPFGGVASMCEAALLTARRYWSCEIDEHYYKIGELRLQGIQKSGFFLQ
jgi:DNA modification methylase